MTRLMKMKGSCSFAHLHRQLCQSITSHRQSSEAMMSTIAHLCVYTNHDAPPICVFVPLWQSQHLLLPDVGRTSPPLMLPSLTADVCTHYLILIRVLGIVPMHILLLLIIIYATTTSFSCSSPMCFCWAVCWPDKRIQWGLGKRSCFWLTNCSLPRAPVWALKMQPCLPG